MDIFDGKLSIYECIMKMIDPETGKNPYGKDELPDADEVYHDQKLRWVSGGLDGVFGHHGNPCENPDLVQNLYESLRKYCSTPSEETRRALYHYLQKCDVLSDIDAVMNMIRQKEEINPRNLYQVSCWLAKYGTHREAVKTGIALLGMFRTIQAEHREMLLTLGKHEEFTLYVAVSLKDNDSLFQLAKYVDGWGKISIVERLEANTDEIKDWILRFGCKNTIMDEYLAYPCAVKGELHKGMFRAEEDDQLFEGISTIVSALVALGGPEKDIDDYEYSFIIIPDFIRIAQRKQQTEKLIRTIFSIQSFLLLNEDEWIKRYKNGWTEALRFKCIQKCDSIIRNSVEIEMIGKPDIWEMLFAQLKIYPQNVTLYSQLLDMSGREGMSRIVEFAEENLRIDEIAIGPTSDNTYCSENMPLICLKSIIQFLDRYEGLGAILIETGLWSPVIHTRYISFKVLETWNVNSWTPGIIKRLIGLEQKEPEEELKLLACMLLRKAEQQA